MRWIAVGIVATIALLAWLASAMAVEKSREARPAVPAWHAQLQICAPIRPAPPPTPLGKPHGTINGRAPISEIS